MENIIEIGEVETDAFLPREEKIEIMKELFRF